MGTRGALPTHGDGTPKSKYYRIYTVYRGMIMITRCYYKKGSKYRDYGGCGITVCDEWLNNYREFKAWALISGWRYEPQENGINKWSIDRIDNDKGYSPGNCRWTTTAAQRHNQRPYRGHKKRLIAEIGGIVKTRQEWCAEYGITQAAVYYRMKTLGMTFEQALTLPKNQGRSVY